MFGVVVRNIDGHGTGMDDRFHQFPLTVLRFRLLGHAVHRHNIEH